MNEAIIRRIHGRLSFVYGQPIADRILPDIESLLARYSRVITPKPPHAWSAADALLITYADSITGENDSPLTALTRFLRKRVGARLNWVHLLPFFPWSSDDGFSVIDYRAVNPPAGTWSDISALSADYQLAFDGVINHCSQESRYVREFLAGNPDYARFVIALPPDTDTSSVLRTRNLPLLHDYRMKDGSTVWLWTTFSRDQVDFNFSNPRVLLEILDILLFYAASGASMIRLDAIPYMWKRLGSSCAHLPETHELIKLMRDVFDAVAPHVVLLTETNVPHEENVAYFGNAGDEAQVIYNFSLPPLIIHSILAGSCARLREWARRVRPVAERCTFLNITATHDGIGMRPTEGILSEPERAGLIAMAKARGGDITGKRNPDGSISPYELNISYFDAVNDPASAEPQDAQVQRFMMSQTIAMSFIGLPGVYIQSLVGSRNDLDGVRRTGRARSINRPALSAEALDRELDSPGSLRNAVYREYCRRLELRATVPAFHPSADQEILDSPDTIFALRRVLLSTGDSVLALHNIVSHDVRMDIGPGRFHDILDQGAPVEGPFITLAPSQCRWLVPAR